MDPGWYSDPWREADARWWSGYEWTPHVWRRPSPLPPAPRRPWVHVGLVVALLLGATLAGADPASPKGGVFAVDGVLMVLLVLASAFLVRSVRLWIKIIAVLVALFCLPPAVYDVATGHTLPPPAVHTR